MWQRQNGFSLLEMMIVVAIIAIVGVMAMPAYQKYRNQSDVVQASEHLQEALSIIKAAEVREPAFTAQLNQAQLSAFLQGEVLACATCQQIRLPNDKSIREHYDFSAQMSRDNAASYYLFATPKDQTRKLNAVLLADTGRFWHCPSVNDLRQQLAQADSACKLQ